MSFSVYRYESSRGKRTRVHYEVVEVGPRGAILRTVARTPAIIGDNDEATKRIIKAENEAKRMADGLSLGEAGLIS